MASEIWATTDGDDEPFLGDAIRAVLSIGLAARALRAVAMTAGVVWLVGTISTVWFVWGRSDQYSSGLAGSGPGGHVSERLGNTISTTVSATWGYALVAVLALIGWLYAESRRASVLLDAIDEIDETRAGERPTSPLGDEST